MDFRAAFQILIIVWQFASGIAAILPDYISQCSLSDPNISKCMVENANKAIPTIAKGDRKYKINPMNPLSVTLIDLSSGGLNLKLTDVKISHIEDLRIQTVVYDQEKQHLEFTATNPSLIVESKYEVNGQILILPIKGEGPARFTLDKGTYKYTVDFGIEQKNGKEHLKLMNSDCKIELGGATFDFQNLFNGDKTLGGEVNKFLNENWSDVMKEFYPAIILVIKGIVESTIAGYFGTVPRVDVFHS